MKTVKLIELKVTEIPSFNMNEVRYHVREPVSIDFETFTARDAIPSTMQSTTRIAPVLRFCNKGRDDVYVAYTEETEELLGIPIRSMKNQIDGYGTDLGKCTHKTNNLSNRLEDIRNMDLWQRFKFLVGKELP